jgi:hypothetical protein
MNRKKLLIGIVVVALVALAGCSGQTGEDDAKNLADDAGVDINKSVEPGGSYWMEILLTEKNQRNLVQKRPPFEMDDSLERQNLIRRYKYLNDKNNEHYVYLLSHGKVVAHYVAQGKVSSLNSKLTNDEQIVGSSQCVEDVNADSEGGCYKTVESPQMDGSYGTNGDGIFFFTTDGEYVEWNGQYVVSEEPMNVQTPLTLTTEVNTSSP